MNNRIASRSSRHRLALFEALERRALFSAGSLDPTFGQGGILHITDPQTLATTTTASAMQADGKTLLAGNSQTDAGAVGTLARLTASGGPDPTFGRGGLLTLSAPGYSQLQVGSLAMDPAGNILVAGRVISRHGVALAAVARLRADGSLDATFGDGGWAALAFGSQPSVNAIAVAPDGGILVGGSSVTKRTHEDLTVARLNTDGSVDGTFGKGGRTVVAFAPGRRHPGRANVAVEALAVQSDGGIVAVGGGDRAVMARLTPGGAIDATFGNAGGVSLAGRRERFTSVALADSGEIFAAGGVPSGFYNSFGGSTHLLVAAFTPGGALDPAFGDGGEVVQFIGASARRSAASDAAGIRLTADGKILVAGGVKNAHVVGTFVERLNPDGSTDQTFGSRGFSVFSTTVLPVEYSSVPPVAVGLLAEPDGGYVVPFDGLTTTPVTGGRAQLRATRFNADGSIDTAFGASGLAEAAGPFGPGYNAVDGMATTPGDELAILGSTRDARFLAHAAADGTLDPSFGQGGEAVVPFDRAVMTPDGKWVAITLGDYGEYGLTRYNADGTVDSTFGANGYVRLGNRGSAIPPQELYARDDGSVVVKGYFGTDNPDADYLTTLFVVANGNVTARLQKTNQNDDQAGDSFGAFASPADGDVLAVVYSYNPNAPWTTSVARYHADLTPDTSFGMTGVASLAWLPGEGAPFFSVKTLATASDGSVYLAADLSADGSTVIGRLTPAGQPDLSFAGSGYLRIYGGSRPTVIVQADGKVLLATTSGRTLTLTRYSADGSLDTGFGTGGQAVVDLGGVVANVSFGFQTVNGVQELLVGGQAYFGPRLGTDAYHESDGFVARVEL